MTVFKICTTNGIIALDNSNLNEKCLDLKKITFSLPKLLIGTTNVSLFKNKDQPHVLYGFFAKIHVIPLGHYGARLKRGEAFFQHRHLKIYSALLSFNLRI